MFEANLANAAKALAAQRFKGDAKVDLKDGMPQFNELSDDIERLGCSFSRKGPVMSISLKGLREPIISFDINAANRGEVNVIELFGGLKTTLEKSSWLREKIAMPRKEIDDKTLSSMMSSLFKPVGEKFLELSQIEIAELCELKAPQVSKVLGVRMKNLPTGTDHYKLNHIGLSLQEGAEKLGGKAAGEIFKQLFSEFSGRVDAARGASKDR